MTRAPILVHGATGFTGGLVCELLAARGMTFAVSGRSRERLERLRDRLIRSGGTAPVELCVVDVEDAAGRASLTPAIEGRRIVLACAGPFVELGEPVLAACGRLGVHYADTTGEQRYVADAYLRHHAAFRRSGACAVPSMGFEIAPADWASHLAAERVGGEPDTLDIFYSSVPSAGSRGETTRGTKKSILGVMTDRAPLQWIEGALAVEATAEKTTSFALPSGRRLAAVSFPGPEAVVVPHHTGARTVRTYMAMSERTVRTLHGVRKLAPSVARLTRPLVARWLDRTAVGPYGDERATSFTIIAEATKGNERCRVAITGKDPYGLTAELQVYAAQRALEGAIAARGVVAPSAAFAPREALEALAHTGLTLVEPG